MSGKKTTPHSEKQPFPACPICNAPLQRLSLVCPSCRREIEEPIESALVRKRQGKKAKAIPPLTEENRQAADLHERDLRRANVIVFVVLFLAWFLIYVLTP